MLGDELARQWLILGTIESEKQGIAVAELASQEDCSPRTIWRDLAAIQEAGFPLYTEKSGQKISIRELMSLYFYPDILRVFKDTVFYESLYELFRKVGSTLPPESLSYLRFGQLQNESKRIISQLVVASQGKAR